MMFLVYFIFLILLFIISLIIIFFCNFSPNKQIQNNTFDNKQQLNKLIHEPFFYVVIATYYRKNGKSKFFVTRALEALKNQIYKNFKIILIGDKYTNESEFFEYSIIDSRIILHNMEKPGERDTYFGSQLWYNAGVTAMNRGIKEIENSNGEWYVHLDDDDYYTNDHLQILADNIMQSHANFLFTQSQYRDINEKFPYSEILYPIDDNNLLAGGKLIHSAICFNIKELNSRYTIGDYPADGRIYDHLKLEKNLRVRFIPCITVYHLSEHNSEEFEPRLKGNFQGKNKKYFWVESEPSKDIDSLYFISRNNIGNGEKSYEFDIYFKNKEYNVKKNN